jgi:hypothetical protein
MGGKPTSDPGRTLRFVSVRVRGHIYRRGGKLVTVKPYVRASTRRRAKKIALGMDLYKAGYRRRTGGSLVLKHSAKRNRAPGRLPIGSSQLTPKATPSAAPRLPDLKQLSIMQLANLVERDWSGRGKGVNYAARPYLDAMKQLHSHRDNYYYDPGHMVIRYFLSNARGWSGPTAKAVKAELNRRLKSG